MNKELLSKFIENNIEFNNVIEYQILISQLKNTHIEQSELKELLPTLSIDDNEIIIISDTHYGSIFDNYDYIKLVYEYAAKNNIKTIIHGGDFIQGTYKPLRRNGQNVFDQTEEVLNKYPYDKNINNYLLFGNHDYLLIRQSIEKTFEIFNARKDINIIGLKQAYVNWKNYLLSFYHNVDKVDLYNFRVNTLMRFLGHRHDYNYTDDLRKVFLPTLSDDIKYYGDVVYPGFVKAKFDDEVLDIRYYPIAKNKIYDTTVSLRKELIKYDYLNE